MTHLLFGATLDIKGAARITKIMQHQKMSSASPGASDLKPTCCVGCKAPTLRPDPNTSGTAGGRVVIYVLLEGARGAHCHGWHPHFSHKSFFKIHSLFNIELLYTFDRD